MFLVPFSFLFLLQDMIQCMGADGNPLNGPDAVGTMSRGSTGALSFLCGLVLVLFTLVLQ